jgi:CelD/BcsL family acetyltransferase involved in cellulose biosynthesis
MNNWKFRTIEGYDYLCEPKFRKEWQQLLDVGEHSHVFFTPDIVKAWLDTYIPLRDLRPILVIAESCDNISLLPLTIWRRNWKNAFMKMIVPIGFSDYDYHNPIFKISPDADSLKSYWLGLIDYLLLHYKYDIIRIDGITDSFISPSGLDWHKSEICPQLNLQNISNEVELMAFFKTSLRGDIRRQIRRLEELGELKYREFSSWDEIPKSTFHDFMCQHTLRWPHAYKAPHFHENLLKAGLGSGIVHFSVLSVGDKEIAWHLGFSYRGRYYYYMPAGNRDYFKFSPTKIHLYYLVKRAVENGYEVFDHLRGEENYKSGWSNDSFYVNSTIVYNQAYNSVLKRKVLEIRRLIRF